MQADLIVVGGGILGTFHAYHALKRGLKVILFERNQRPQGATVRNFGQVVPSGLNRKWQAFGRRSLEIYRDLQAEADISIRQQGTMYLASNAEELTLIQELNQINDTSGYRSELWDAQACKKRYPGLQDSYCQGGLFFPQEVTVEPDQMIHRVLGLLVEQYGLQYNPSTRIDAVESEGAGCKVRDHRGKEYHAAQTIVCSGVECQSLFPEIIEESDLVVSKLQMLQTVPQPSQVLPGSILTGWSIRRYESFVECPSYVTIKVGEDPDSPQRKWGVHILFKQALDGSVIVGDSHEYAPIARQEELGFDLKADINRFMMDESRKIIQLQDDRIRTSWAGFYSQTPDGNLFTHTIDARIHLITGIGGKGMTSSAGYAEKRIEELFNLQPS
ncbi:TIGR03364 family FAD-dependent oxidoreductase [Pontibacter sp. G13]|uniref:TIGR03364 family FAD-dependent oxidoreductase n=1 Tax=Pontibacter sp. G13 TaxID=3074898 RepID=UPI00288BE9A5|nr:TIGR03364 family FAD-dependent oxidoreductase [Pontibacter sp. G13]WNJ16553.1 TIGR03364 family FAD-dependent oxidoreductase [Pontibacter sp. G13]